MGSVFRALETPSKAAGPWEPGQPRPALPSGEQRAGGEIGLRSFPEPRCVGAVVGCPRRLSLCQMQPPEARFGPPVQPTSRCAPELAQGAWLRRGPRRLSHAQSCFPAKENPSGVGFGHQRPQANSQGLWSQGQPRPTLPCGEQRAEGENGLRCFPEPRRVGAVVGCPRRVSLCTVQLPEARFGPSVRQALGAERPS